MFNRTNLLIVVIAVAGALAGFLAGGWLRPGPVSAPAPSAGAARGLRVGDVVTPVSLPDLDGKPRSLSEWNGKLILVNFWASWCGPCREEMPLLDASHQRLAAKGLQVVGIASDSTTATKAFLTRHPVRYPILIDDPQRGDDVSADFGDSRGVLPYTVLIGRDGRILAQRAGNFTQTSLDRWLAPHL